MNTNTNRVLTPGELARYRERTYVFRAETAVRTRLQNSDSAQAEIPALTGSALKSARYEYMLATACASTIPATHRRTLSGEDLELLEHFCQTARGLGRVPTIAEAGLPPEITVRTRHVYGSWELLIRHMGIPLTHRSVM